MRDEQPRLHDYLLWEDLGQRELQKPHLKAIAHRCLFESLRKIARLLLCKRNHQHKEDEQVQPLAERWYESARACCARGNRADGVPGPFASTIERCRQNVAQFSVVFTIPTASVLECFRTIGRFYIFPYP
jgi:hypothetical protein